MGTKKRIFCLIMDYSD